MITYIAKQPEKRILDKSNTEDQPQLSDSMQPTKRISHAPAVQPLKLSQKEYHEAYHGLMRLQKICSRKQNYRKKLNMSTFHNTQLETTLHPT